ncbi:hypothetical protein KJ836_01145 [Patescibacteria group bacterium]|nr:hypothetical protein [Patescibacteria group bacterium]
MTSWSSKQSGISNQGMIKMRSLNKIKWGNFSITSMSIMLFVALTISYVVVINVVSTKGAQIHTLELTKRSLVSENERLAVEAARLQSLAVIEKGATEQIEIGDDGNPTGKTKPADQFIDNSTLTELTTYEPKMVLMSGLSFINDTDDMLAQR